MTDHSQASGYPYDDTLILLYDYLISPLSYVCCDLWLLHTECLSKEVEMDQIVCGNPNVLREYQQRQTQIQLLEQEVGPVDERIQKGVCQI